MRHVFLLIGVILAWVVVIWGCFTVAFGIADLYTVTLGGAVPGEPGMMGERNPTVIQSIAEIAVGVGLISFALFCIHRIRRKMRQIEAAG